MGRLVEAGPLRSGMAVIITLSGFCAKPVLSLGSRKPVLSHGSRKPVLSHGSAKPVLSPGSAKPVLSLGSAKSVLSLGSDQYFGRVPYRCCSAESAAVQKIGSPSSICESAEARALKAACLNLERLLQEMPESMHRSLQPKCAMRGLCKCAMRGLCNLSVPCAVFASVPCAVFATLVCHARSLQSKCAIHDTRACLFFVCRNLNLDCSVLIGGNVAKDLGNKELSEAVIGA